MANVNPPVKNQAWSCLICLEDMSNPGSFKNSPTIAASDFKYSIDDGAFATAEITVTVDPAATESVKISMTAAGMNGDVILIKGQDQTTPKEWADIAICILTTTA